MTRTQRDLEATVTRPPWEGVVGCPPALESLKRALGDKDFYFFAGHGDGGKCVPPLPTADPTTVPSLSPEASPSSLWLARSISLALSPSPPLPRSLSAAAAAMFPPLRPLPN